MLGGEVCHSRKPASAFRDRSLLRCGTQQRFQRTVEQRRSNALHDEYNPGGAILIGPLFEVDWWMNNVLHAVKDDGPRGIGYPQQAFHAQDFGAVTVQQ